MYKCGVCGSDKDPIVKMHKLGRHTTCTVCGYDQVMVRRVEVKEVEPGQGRPRMSKKERKTFRAWLAVHGDEFLIDMEKTLRA